MKTIVDDDVRKQVLKRKCVYCGHVLKPNYETVKDPHDPQLPDWKRANMATGIRWYGYSVSGLFCSLRCGYRWACAEIHRKQKAIQ